MLIASVLFVVAVVVVVLFFYKLSYNGPHKRAKPCLKRFAQNYIDILKLITFPYLFSRKLFFLS